MAKKNLGKAFEDLVKLSAKEQEGWDSNRMRDAGFTGAKQEGKRFTVRNICDYTLFGDGRLYYVECKHSKDKSLAFSRLSQHPALLKKNAEGTRNVHVGYLLCMNSDFYYVSVFQMDELIKFSGKKSVNATQLIEMDCALDKIKTSRQRTWRVDLSSLPKGDYS